MNTFVKDDFKIYINDIIRNNILINLNIDEFNEIIILLINLIDYIAIRFNFDLDNIETYIYQLKQNNNRDIYAIFNLLLPYIDDNNNSYILHKEIYYIKDISIKKINNNIIKNPYLISNIQYNRHIINFNHTNISNTLNEIDNNNYIEYEFSINDILNNFILLLLTLDQISNKLYINWINIKPITNYKECNLYLKTFKYDENNDTFFININGNEIKRFSYNYLIEQNIDIKNNIILDTNNLLFNYEGLSIGDIYNMIHHELYFGIKELKWLIYDLPKDDNNYNIYYNYLDLFNNIFPTMFDYITNNIIYDNIIDLDINNWILIKDKLINDIKTNHIINKLIYNILYFLQRKYSDQYNLNESKYIILGIQSDNNLLLNLEDYEYDNILDSLDEDQSNYIINENDVIISWQSLTIEHLYKYMKETIEEFKKTWYGYNIITLKKKYPFNDDDDIKMEFNLNNYKVTYKNIYNYAKSILLNTHISTNKHDNITKNLYFIKKYTWSQLGYYKNDSDLNNIDKQNITNLLIYTKNMFENNINTKKNDPIQWFNINKIIDSYYSNTFKTLKLSITNINNFKQKLMQYIYIKIKKHIIDICFECLFIRGLLNEFIINKDQKHVLTSENIDKYNECFYYLTGEQYKYLPKNILKDNTLDYFTFLKNAKWYTFYAMDWVAQIHFFHRYINNRILYVTGATGQGKSTQMPKLLLYALKMIDFNSNGKVVSTQPRITPTISNAKNIANELGVPITVYSKTLNDYIKTYLGYVQYKTQKDYHLIESSKYFLREMTDGTLISELLKNPLLKIQKTHNKDNPYNDELIFSLNNIYDIIIIDESHEHNKNMDIILTLIRYAIFWNNSLKLIIISATMTDDEPIYRRYYKDINDNMMYPLNFFNAGIIYNYNNTINTLDRCTVDRRHHISAPGTTTQYKVTDIYLKKDTLNYNEAEEQGINKLFELINKGVKGDILFFTLGQSQIINLVNIFNNKTPTNVIALPFYGALSEYWKEIAEKTKEIVNIDFNKKDLFKEISLKGSASKVPKGTYTQAIIVATNIAEASITILNLKYVIDTGYYNSVTYDAINKITINESAKITESNRIQRRGRVGRVSDGTVYYMYEYNARFNIKPLYNICNENIKIDLFKLLRKKNDEYLLINNNYNIYYIDTLKSEYKYNKLNIINNLDKYNTLIHHYLINYNYTFSNLISTNYVNNNNINKYHNVKTWKSIHDIMIHQYLYNFLDGKTKINFLYFGNKNLNDYYFSYEKLTNRIYTPPIRYFTGYNLSTLIDFHGTFYIIHPGEDLLYREKLSGLVNLKLNLIIKKLNNNFIKKIFSYIGSLFYSRMIIPNKVILNIDLTGQNFNDTNILPKFNYFNNGLYSLYENICFLNNNIDDYIYSKKYINYTNDIFSKTSFADKLLSLQDKIELDKDTLDQNFIQSCILALIYGKKLGIEKEICQTIASMLAHNFNPEKILLKDNNNKINYKKNPLKFFKNYNGDIIIYYNIFKTFYNDFNHLKIWNIYRDNTSINIDYNNNKKIYYNLKNTLITNFINGKNILDNVNFNQSFELRDFILFQKIDQRNNLNERVGYKEFINDNKTRIKKNIIDFDAIEIIKWSNNYYLDYKNIVNMIKKYLSIINKLFIEEEHFEWFNKSIYIKKEKTIEENILKCFLFGFIENISIFLKEKYFEHIISKKKISFSKYLPSYTTKPYKFIFYISIDNKNNIININNVDIKWILEYIPDIFFNNNIINNNYIIDIIKNYNKFNFLNATDNNLYTYLSKYLLI